MNNQLEYSLIEKEVPMDGTELSLEGEELGFGGNPNYLAQNLPAGSSSAFITMVLRNNDATTKIIAFGGLDFSSPELQSSIVAAKTVNFNPFGHAVGDTANGITLISADQDPRTFAIAMLSGALVMKSMQVTVTTPYQPQAQVNPVYTRNSFTGNPEIKRINAASALNQYANNPNTNFFNIGKVLGTENLVSYQINPSKSPATLDFNEVQIVVEFSYQESSENALVNRVERLGAIQQPTSPFASRRLVAAPTQQKRTIWR